MRGHKTFRNSIEPGHDDKRQVCRSSQPTKLANQPAWTKLVPALYTAQQPAPASMYSARLPGRAWEPEEADASIPFSLHALESACLWQRSPFLEAGRGDGQ